MSPRPNPNPTRRAPENGVPGSALLVLGHIELQHLVRDLAVNQGVVSSRLFGAKVGELILRVDPSYQVRFLVDPEAHGCGGVGALYAETIGLTELGVVDPLRVDNLCQPSTADFLG